MSKYYILYNGLVEDTTGSNNGSTINAICISRRPEGPLVDYTKLVKDPKTHRRTTKSDTTCTCSSQYNQCTTVLMNKDANNCYFDLKSFDSLCDILLNNGYTFDYELTGLLNNKNNSVIYSNMIGIIKYTPPS